MLNLTHPQSPFCHTRWCSQSQAMGIRTWTSIGGHYPTYHGHLSFKWPIVYLQLTRPDYPPYARNWSSDYIFHIAKLIFICTRAMWSWHCHFLWNSGTEAQESCHFSKISGPKVRGIPRISTNFAVTPNPTFFLCHLFCLTQHQKKYSEISAEWVLLNSAWPHSLHSLCPLKV